jgi:hypothetical protein
MNIGAVPLHIGTRRTLGYGKNVAVLLGLICRSRWRWRLYA